MEKSMEYSQNIKKFKTTMLSNNPKSRFIPKGNEINISKRYLWEIQDVGQGRESEILSSMIPKTTLRRLRYTWVILIASSQNNNRCHIRCA
jgi:hypothetical protein